MAEAQNGAASRKHLIDPEVRSTSGDKIGDALPRKFCVGLGSSLLFPHCIAYSVEYQFAIQQSSETHCLAG